MKHDNKSELVKFDWDALKEEFLSGGDGETTEDLSVALLDFILRREHIRRGIENSNLEVQTAVDNETLAKLKNCDFDDPDLFLPEKILRRLGTDPVSAVRLLQAAIERQKSKMSMEQSLRAKKPRLGRRSYFAPIIDEIVESERSIKTITLIHRLKKHPELDFNKETNEFIHRETRSVITMGAVGSALTRSKKRVYQFNSVC